MLASPRIEDPKSPLVEVSEILSQKAQTILARRYFWDYCKTFAPLFYHNKRQHLRKLAQALQDLYRGQLVKADGSLFRKMMIQLPPQHGKTRTMIKFCTWVFGQNPGEKIVLGSYNDIVASEFSMYARDEITQERLLPLEIIYSDVFPDTRVKYGQAPKMRWALDGQHFSYIAAGIGGSLTGKGGTILIIDDPVKGAEEALNDDHLEKVWRWYTNTYKTRISAEYGDPIEIYISTPWSRYDPGGMLLNDSRQAAEWYVLSMPVIDIPYHQVVNELDLPLKEKTGTMLCSELYDRKALDNKISLPKSIPEVDRANYWHERLDIAGRLYPNMLEYDELPAQHLSVHAYIDTADEGESFLCAVCYVPYMGYNYVIDVYHTQDPMEVTEPETAKFLSRNKCRYCLIESNNGGRGFSRNVERILRSTGNNITVIDWFHQSKNKDSRILTNAGTVQRQVLMPKGWKNRWPLFAEQITEYHKEGKNKFQDAADVITGIAEQQELTLKVA